MKRNRLTIGIWLTMAVAAASLTLASAASAMPDINGSAGPKATPQVPVAVPGSGFNWAIAAAVALTVVLAAIAVGYVARSHSRHVAVPS